MVISKTQIEMVEHDKVIREHVVAFFTYLFSRTETMELSDTIPFKKKLSNKGRAWLSRDLEKEEVKQVVFEGDPDKAPGLDGFTFGFFQLSWEIIKEDLWKGVQHGKLVKELNHTFLTLTPKPKHSVDIKNFRLIACCNVLYKIIAKILANRLQKVLGLLVLLNQSTFIKRRQTSDSILVMHELVRFLEEDW